MKKFSVEIMRKTTADGMWYLSKTVTIEAKTEKSAYNKAEKSYASPYCMVGAITMA